MLKKTINSILMSLLIIKLIINLVVFSVQYLILKLKTKKGLTPLLWLILLIICLINWQLWQKRKNPKIELKAALSRNSGEILFALEPQEIQELKNFYLKLEKKQKNSRDVLYNLAKLLELEENSLAREKFRQSWELDPNYSTEIFQ